MDLTGKVALVTGAAAGLGKAIAIAFAQAGARVAICDINEKGLGETKAAVEALGAECLGLRCDVSSSCPYQLSHPCILMMEPAEERDGHD